MTSQNLPVIPETVTVHLGAPSAPAQNITVPFAEYIKNVASSEIYPTWSESAIIANIYAQTSFALNRIYTAFYPIARFLLNLMLRVVFSFPQNSEASRESKTRLI